MVYAFMVVDMDCKNCIYGKDDFKEQGTLKKVTNSRVRNYAFDFQKGSAYKKVHDRWNYD